MQLIIILRKEVETQEQGQALYDIVKEQYVENPEIDVKGSISNQLIEDEG